MCWQKLASASPGVGRTLLSDAFAFDFSQRAKSKPSGKSVRPTHDDRSTTALRFSTACDSGKRASVGRDSFRNGLAIDELPFAAAGDEFGLTEDLEMVRDGRRGHAAHGDDLATGHLAGRRHGLKDSKPRLVRQGFRYFLNLGTVHARFRV